MSVQQKDYIDALSDNFEKRFRRELVQVQLEYVKKHKPFCYRCAKIDFLEKLNTMSRETQFTSEQDKESPSTIVYENLLPKDVNAYGDSKRFELLKEEEVFADQLISGVKVPNLIGVRQIFRCKNRKCGHAVEVPLKLWEARTGKQWKKYEDGLEDETKQPIIK